MSDTARAASEPSHEPQSCGMTDRRCSACRAALPFPEGTVLRCTRWTEWGEETVYGTVKEWHSPQGWVVISPHGGIAAGPGPGVFIDFRQPTGVRVESEEWRFEPVATVIDGQAAKPESGESRG
jgi:hypothetical protein